MATKKKIVDTKIKNDKNIPAKTGSRLLQKINAKQRPFHIVCIGASAGGLHAVAESVSA